MITFEEVEQKLGVSLPDEFRRAATDIANPLHDRLLLLDGDHNIVSVNIDLRGIDWKHWPEFMVAFATEGCGDYFAFDTRSKPHRIYYIDPIGTAEESMRECEAEGFVFGSFAEWEKHELEGAE